MTLPNLISFSGHSDSGKRTATDLMYKRARFSEFSMSDPMVNILLKLNPWVGDHTVGSIERFSDLHTNLGLTATLEFEEARRLFRVLSNDVGREDFSSTFWTDIVFGQIRTYLDRGIKVALSGVRHHDELALVRQHGGICVWIERPRTRPRNSNHTASIITADDCDVVVQNDGTPRELYVNIVTAVEEYMADDDE